VRLGEHEIDEDNLKAQETDKDNQVLPGNCVQGDGVVLYQLAYSFGYNALTYTYLIELFPYYVRTKGVSWFQLFGFQAIASRAMGLTKVEKNPVLLPKSWNHETPLVRSVYTAWTIAQARQMITGEESAGIAVIALIFLYQLDQVLPGNCVQGDGVDESREESSTLAEELEPRNTFGNR
jgi:hypothetical protein